MSYLHNMTPGQFGAALAFLFFAFRLALLLTLGEWRAETYRPFGPDLAGLALSISVGLMANSPASALLWNSFLLVVHILVWVLLWVWSKLRKVTDSPFREWGSAVVGLILGSGVYLLAIARLWTSTRMGG